MKIKVELLKNQFGEVVLAINNKIVIGGNCNGLLHTIRQKTIDTKKLPKYKKEKVL